MAREAGYRTKIAVWSANDKVDPVGACVGMRGARVKNIVRELNNEKVDLFKWSPNIRELVMEALKPAKLKTLEVDEANKKVTVLVDEENLSLAIGRRGQNARLTQKLTGWEIDVKKEEEVAALGFEQKLAKASEALAAQLQIEPALAEQFVRGGFLSAEGIAEVEVDDLTGAVPDLDPAVAKQIHEKARSQTAAPSPTA
jgi:N utilization substance protein A